MCILEIAMTVMGIIALAKGKVTLGGKVVPKGPSILVGLLLTLTFPAALGIGFVIGAKDAMEGKQPPADGIAWEYIWIDVAVVAVLGLLSLIITVACAKDPRDLQKQQYYGSNYGPDKFQPSNPHNPYQSPQTGGQNPFGDQPQQGYPPPQQPPNVGPPPGYNPPDQQQ